MRYLLLCLIIPLLSCATTTPVKKPAEPSRSETLAMSYGSYNLMKGELERTKFFCQSVAKKCAVNFNKGNRDCKLAECTAEAKRLLNMRHKLRGVLLAAYMAKGEAATKKAMVEVEKLMDEIREGFKNRGVVSK